MRRTLSSLILALPVVAALGRTRLDAQELRTAVADSTVADFVALSTFKLLAGYTARASRGVSAAWIVEVPEDSPRWRALTRHIRIVLNARDTSANDVRRMVLQIDKPSITQDSVFVRITLSGTSLCEKQWMHTGTTWEARAAHHGPYGLVPELTPLFAIDSFECHRR